MDGLGDGVFSKVYVSICNFLRKLLWAILAVGPIPNHVAVIMDGNRRFARTRKLEKEYGHRFGFLSLISTLRNCYELGIKYVTVYAFSIDNFKRKPDEVGGLMELLQEKLEDALKEESFIKTCGIKVLFVGNLSLLPEQVQDSAKKLMEETAHNTRAILSVCVCYTSTDEIAHAVQEACDENRLICTMRCNSSGTNKGNSDEFLVTLADLEKHMYMAHCPDPDILIRTSGETRLSNFLLWQSCFCYLHITKALWPEFSLRHLVWAILEYQRVQPYLEKMKKKL
ncbi:dehydrodolichyl diphosphate synthase CPT3-like [Nymphaea colorata]|nr:dehydrodolichyl diphosphate synthase CPT3-like [Nymphaea colorata]XP_031484057.1 dehydrodolichyl diphosphate synthase CPT3-like [Nymphaea colorata]